ncbi:hypothetical protein FWH13_00385 [Candidatus Saccharibacteria bacterium]|nr:hypothetical protein [Candidatus Saccharibacteria bacterium]
MLWGLFELLICGVSTTSTSRPCPTSYWNIMDVIYRIAGTAAIISATATVTANFLNIKNHTPTIKLLKTTVIASATFLGFYFLPAIWSSSSYLSYTWRLAAVAAIIFVFSNIITLILTRIEKTKLQKSPPNRTSPQPIDETKLRQEIEAEVRAKIAAEQAEQADQNEQTNQTP